MEGTFSKISNNIEYDYIIIARPGHGAPTQDIRKKKFTEHQLRRSQSVLSLGDTAGDLVQLRTSYRDDMVLDPKVDTTYNVEMN